MAIERAERSEDPKAPGRPIAFRSYVLGLFLLVWGVLAAVLGIVVTRDSRELVERSVLASFTGAADLALKDLSRQQELARAAAEALAANPIVATTTQEERFERLYGLATVLRSAPDLSAAYVGWPNGDFLLLRPVGAHREALAAPEGAEWMAQVAGSGRPRFVYLAADLSMVSVRTDSDYDFDPRERPWFQGASASSETVVTQPYVFFTTREPGISAARRAASGAVVGVDLSLWDLSRRLPLGRPVPSSIAAVFGPSGGVLAHSDVERLAALVEASVQDPSAAAADVLPAAEGFGEPILAALAAKAAGGGERFLGVLSDGGQEWLALAEPLVPGVATFAMAAPLDELGAGPRSIRSRLLWVLAIAGAVALTVAWFSARALARPLEAFAGEARRFARLDLRPSATVGPRVRELRDLEEAMGSMRRSLRSRLMQLQCLYRVLEATADNTAPLAEVCSEVARILQGGLGGPSACDLRLTLQGTTCRAAADVAGAAVFRSEIPGSREADGSIEALLAADAFGRDATAPGSPPLGEEERAEVQALLDVVAAHLASMLYRRRVALGTAQSDRMVAIGQLTSGVAHDFNNLLTPILGNAEQLAETLPDGTPVQHQASVILFAAERAAQLTERLLAFSRRQALDTRPIDVNELLRKLEPLMRRSLGEQYEIELRLGSGPLVAVVDPNQLENAVLNLAVNARDAMPGGGRLVVVTGEAALEDGEEAGLEADEAPAAGAATLGPNRCVLLSVSDEGQGMPPEVRERAFEPFFTTKAAGAGTGLGLSMVYGFVRQSGGRLALRSEPGQGTTVTLYLPGAEQAPLAVPAGDAAAGAPEGGRERILVVEDNDLVRTYTCQTLASLGYRYVAVEDGEAAARAVAEGLEFDLLLTDLVLGGGMSGRQLAETVGERRPGLPVLFVTGFADDPPDQGATAEGRQPILYKPFRREELAARLREMLGGQAAGQG